jgi:hypothetical protein
MGPHRTATRRELPLVVALARLYNATMLEAFHPHVQLLFMTTL